MNKKHNIFDCTFSDIKKIEYVIPILPWGACEPHGLHLSYCTDILLAEKIASEAIMHSKNPSSFIMLPSIGYGSQNIGQTNKKLCIHLSCKSQMSIIEDIVSSLEKQGLNKLIIINGHNGNDFKTIVRDLEFTYDNFIMYVCNYLDLADNIWMYNHVTTNLPRVDDHAGFTETSLMLYYFPEYVDESKMQNSEKLEWYPKKDNKLWTPRDWDKYSIDTRVGEIGFASAEYGKKIAEHIVEQLSEELSKITY